MRKRKYTLDESVFDTITEESSYWIGFFAADGTVSGRYPRVGLDSKDEDHLEKLKKFIKSNCPILRYNGPRKNQVVVTLIVYSKRIKSKLLEYGLTPHKTYTLAPPQWLLDSPRNIQLAFIRGYFDGDGSIWSYTDSRSYLRYGLSITGTEQIIKFCAEILCHDLEEEAKVSNINGKISKCLRVVDKRAQYMAHLMYKDAPVDFRLERKYNKYLESTKFYGLVTTEMLKIGKKHGRKEVLCIDLSTGKSDIFVSTVEAAKSMNLSQPSIASAARGKYSKRGTNVYKGYSWHYREPIQ